MTECRYGKLDGSLSPGGSATMSLYRWRNGAWRDSPRRLTVYASLLALRGIATGKRVRVVYSLRTNRWEVISAEC